LDSGVPANVVGTTGVLGDLDEDIVAFAGEHVLSPP
jgi:hypothetical protein